MYFDFDGLIKGLIAIGVIVGIAICLLFYGGCKLASHYKFHIEKVQPQTTIVTNYVTVTNTIVK